MADQLISFGQATTSSAARDRYGRLRFRLRNGRRGTYVQRVRRLLLAGAALLIATAPFFTPTPASAAVYEAQGSASLTFVTVFGNTVTCKLTGLGRHDTNFQRIEAYQSSAKSTGETSPDCNGIQQIQATYKDEQGRARESDAYVQDSSNLNVIAVVGPAHQIVINHILSFQNCDSSMSASCFVQFSTAPK
jgi:hypothetical protein